MSGILKYELSFFSIFSRFFDSVYMSTKILYKPYGMIIYYNYTLFISL